MSLWQWVIVIPSAILGLWAGFVLLTGGDLPMADRYLSWLAGKLRKAPPGHGPD